MGSDEASQSEYTTLREELLRNHRARLVTFVLTMSLLVMIIALTFLFASLEPEVLGPRLFLVYLAHGVIIVALLITHRRTHQMEFTAGYLRTFVMPKLSGARQERPSPRPGAKRRRPLPLQSSRALGGIYALLVSTVVLVGIVNGLYRTLWGVGLPLLGLTGVISAQWLFMSEHVDSTPQMPNEPDPPAAA